MMKILITGSSGFIGSHLINFLNNRFSILEIKRKKFSDNQQVLLGDLNNLTVLKKEILNFDPEIVIHLAWEGIPDYSKKNSIKNYDNSINFLKFIINETNCKKIISTGSCWEYQIENGMCKEENKNLLNINGNNHFINAKKKLFTNLMIACNERNIIFNWLTLFFVYGPGQKRNSIIPYIVESIKNNTKLKISFPQNKNDFINVEDVSKIIYKFLKHSFASGRYNLGSGKTTSVMDLCKIIEIKLLNSNTIYDRMVKEMSNQVKSEFWANMEKTHNAIGSFEFKSIENGIDEYIKSDTDKI